MEKLVKIILEKYQLKAKFIQSAQKGYRNHSFFITLEDNSIVNLIIYKKESGILQKIKSAHYFANILKNSGIPIRYPISKILKIKNDFYACIYNYLPGKTIPWEAYTMDHLKLLGESLNAIHFCSMNYEKQDLISESDLQKTILKRMQIYFNDKNVTNAISEKLKIELNFVNYFSKFKKIIDLVEQSNPKTLLHMDFVRGNILYKDQPKLHISGILDFEKTSYGSPLFDIARTMAFLVVDCKYKSEEEIRKYFLKSGYIKKGKLKLENFKYLNELVAIFLIYDFYKFLKHNPYEFLQNNEHFIRTQNLLLKMRLLSQRPLDL